MRKNILLLFSLFLLGGVYAQDYPKAANTIRLLTYNTHYCKGGTDPGAINENNTKRFASIIKALDADIVSLQELDKGANSRGKRDLLAQIAKFSGLEYNCLFGEAAKYDGGFIGCGTLIKKKFPIVKTKFIPLPGNEARMVIRADLEHFVFMSTHFDLNDNKRIEGAGIIVNELDYIQKPVFLAGDLNDSHLWGNGGIAFPTLASVFTTVSDIEGNSIPGRTDHNALIDYILLRDLGESGIKIVQTHIVRTIDMNGAVADLKDYSDHYPVFVDITFPALSIGEKAEDTFQLYKNAGDHNLYLRGAQNIERVVIYSLLGEKVIDCSENDITKIDISMMNKGIYIVEAYSGLSRNTRKFINE